MQSESTSRSRFPFRNRTGEPETIDEPVVVGRLEWATTLTREQLADLAGRSRTLADAARTRATPVTELPSRRFRLSRQEQVAPLPEPESAGRSAPWMLIAVVAALVSVLIFIAARRSQQRAEDEMAMEFAIENDLLMPEEGLTQPFQTDQGFDDMIVSNP